MKINIPCKKCIVRASCNKICEEMKDYSKNFELRCFIGSIFISYLLLLLTVGIISCFSNIAALIILGIFTVVNFSTGFYFIGSIDAFKECKNLYEKILILGITPVGLTPVITFLHFEDQIEIFLFRHNYKINDRVYKMKERKQNHAGIHWKIWKSKSLD